MLFFKRYLSPQQTVPNYFPNLNEQEHLKVKMKFNFRPYPWIRGLLRYRGRLKKHSKGHSFRKVPKSPQRSGLCQDKGTVGSWRGIGVGELGVGNGEGDWDMGEQLRWTGGGMDRERER